MNNLYTICLVFLLTLVMPYNAIYQQSEKGSIEKIQTHWLEALNESKTLEHFYTERSGLLFNDELFIGIENINKQLISLRNNVGPFNSYKVIEVFQIREKQKFVLGAYKTKSGHIFNTIIGWKYKDTWTKAFEVICDKNQDFNLGIDSVNEKREDWEKFSNQHRPDLIVSEVFSENGKYFNRGIQYRAQEIIGAYSYMSNESYKIKLEALKVLQINNNIVFDIGIFKSGGKGLYTLIWKKEDGNWKLLLDFNF